MIGVIGGNGVAATNKLLSLIEENKTINGAFRDAHHPEDNLAGNSSSFSINVFRRERSILDRGLC